MVHIVHIKQLQLPAAWKQSLGPVECEAAFYHASFAYWFAAVEQWPQVWYHRIDGEKGLLYNCTHLTLTLRTWCKRQPQKTTPQNVSKFHCPRVAQWRLKAVVKSPDELLRRFQAEQRQLCYCSDLICLFYKISAGALGCWVRLDS